MDRLVGKSCRLYQSEVGHRWPQQTRRTSNCFETDTSECPQTNLVSEKITVNMGACCSFESNNYGPETQDGNPTHPVNATSAVAEQPSTHELGEMGRPAHQNDAGGANNVTVLTMTASANDPRYHLYCRTCRDFRDLVDILPYLNSEERADAK
jgi:hypothetical protein